MAVVRQDVANRVLDLGPAPQRVEVTATVEHAPTAVHQAIEAACEADRQAPEPELERGAIVRLHDQVNVISLDRVVHDAESGALRSGHRRPHDPERALGAQVPHESGDANREVLRVFGRERWALPVRFGALDGRATGARTGSTSFACNHQHRLNIALMVPL